MEAMKIKRKSRTRAVDQLTIHNTKEGVSFLSFPLLDQFDDVVNGFSTRLGGVSEGYVGSMNTSFAREASRANVEENHRRLAAAIGYRTEDLVFSKQTHTTNVMVVREEDRGLGFVKDSDYDDIDGLVTNVQGIVLTTFYADCVPLLLVDPVHHAIGTSHSGWRGTVGNIGKETLRVMAEHYGTKPEDVYAAIGPSICQDCYEVSEDVIEQFRAAYPEELWPVLFTAHLSEEELSGRTEPADQAAKHNRFQKKSSDGKYQLNLWEACRQNFLSAGVPADQISLPDLCTCCNPDFLYSHRASGGKRGNLAAFLMLK